MQTELYGNYIFTYHVPIYVKSIFFEIEFHAYSFSLGNDI